MKYIEINIKAKIPFAKNAKIIESPEEDGNQCILIKGNFYTPEITFMKYDPDDKTPEEINLEKDTWKEIAFEQFEELLDKKSTMSMDYNLKVIKDKPRSE
jgi:hypothetical protein